MTKIRYFLAAFICITLTSILPANERPTDGSQAKPAPNILLLVADDLGYGDLSCYGAKTFQTPNIDNIGREGIRFTQFYANAPECSPTRTALLTGRYQQRVGGLECAIGTGNHGRYDDAIRLCAEGQLGLPVKDAELPSALLRVGYESAIFGKWHLGYEPHFSPMEYGWEKFLGPLGGGVDYFHHTEPVGNFLGDDLPGEEMLFQGRKRVEREGYLTEIIAKEAVTWLNTRSGDKPFFLYVPFTAPHTPIQGPGDYQKSKMSAEHWNEGSAETYAEMIEALDDAIGKILLTLQQKGLAEETLVIFFSDNGPTKLGNTGGLRGTKGNVYEGGIRVPCLIRYPNVIAPGEVNHAPYIGMDLTRSIIRIAGATPNRALDGVDILQSIAADDLAAKQRSLFWRKRRGDVTVKAMRQGDWKLVVQQDGDVVETTLYDLATDRAEAKNRAADQPQRFGQMKRALAAWEIEVTPER